MKATHVPAKIRCAMFCAAVCAAIASAAEPTYVFLLGGQSNMSGMASTSGLSAELKAKQQNVTIYLNPSMDGASSLKGKWLPLEPGFGYSNSQFGPELTFASTLTKEYPGKKLALYKSSVSGTDLDKQWRPPASGGTTGKLYTGFVSEMKKALASLDSTGGIIIRGMLWMQGESDAMNLAMSNNYEKNLENFITDIRRETAVADLPFVAANIDEQSTWANYKIVNTAMNNLASKMVNVMTFPTKGFVTDKIHYQTAGMIDLGEAFAGKIISGKYLESIVGIASARATPHSAPSFAAESDAVSATFDLAGRTSAPALQNATAAAVRTLIMIDGSGPRRVMSGVPAMR